MPGRQQVLFAAMVVLSVIFLLMAVGIIIYSKYKSGFTDKSVKIQQSVDRHGDKLTFRRLKSACPECTNVDYYKARQK